VIRDERQKPPLGARLRTIVDELLVFVAHRGELRAGVVEEQVTRRVFRLARQEFSLVYPVERGFDEAGVLARFDLRLQPIAGRSTS
jgi:hypothetical protein